MAEYIERGELLEDIAESVVFTVRKGQPSAEIRGANKVIDRIKAAPAADVVEVKHGEWIMLAEFTDKSICAKCSICEEEYTYKKGRIGNFVHNCYAKYNYCPNCGAKTDLKEGAE